MDNQSHTVFESRSVYEFGDDPPRPATHAAPIVPLVLAAPRPLPMTPTFTARLLAADGETYDLTYRLEQRPEAWVGVLESCRRQETSRG